MLSRVSTAALLAAATLAFASTAFAHVSVSGPGYANQNALLTFGVGHGCEGADTYSIEVTIPKEVTSVRAMPNAFGDAVVTADDAGVVSSVKWTKAGKIHEKDDQYYSLQMRVKLPDAPFTTVLFPTKQVCKKADNTELVTDWKATPEEVAAAKMGEEPEPAPALTILPVRFTGWNKFTAKSKIENLAIFDDAQIVWVKDAAYSKNPVTAEQIKSEDGVTVLTAIEANAEIWVKY